jgi:hypothetical protein
MLVAAVAVATVGCAAVVGRAPRLEALDPAQGFKMLRPAARATVCRSIGLAAAAEEDDLLDAALRQLLARDEEATSVLNAQVESTSWSIGVYGRRCVTLTGDVVRSTTTVLLPMSGHHGHDH